jgi:hypothetical protein
MTKSGIAFVWRDMVLRYSIFLRILWPRFILEISQNMLNPQATELFLRRLLPRGGGSNHPPWISCWVSIMIFFKTGTDSAFFSGKNDVFGYKIYEGIPKLQIFTSRHHLSTFVILRQPFSRTSCVLMVLFRPLDFVLGFSYHNFKYSIWFRILFWEDRCILF